MKLILKRVEPSIETTSLEDIGRRREIGSTIRARPFALHTEDGQVLPCQSSTTIVSLPCSAVELTVKFIIDGKKLRLEGDPAGE
ncbi:hypothetical protein [Pseudomonas coleopterorum]|uniref:hypothetical protein n=1 Tax=Pseudomonas coleopterorum TaxID=1605838 RepID=UPI00089ADB1F|nr:hypothetical protein [Pseudomonas coleopterorum]SEE13532.1 hypothetical protein SAMN05216510_1571 [Pseudomonas coleopterorum]